MASMGEVYEAEARLRSGVDREALLKEHVDAIRATALAWALKTGHPLHECLAVVTASAWRASSGWVPNRHQPFPHHIQHGTEKDLFAALPPLRPYDLSKRLHLDGSPTPVYAAWLELVDRDPVALFLAGFISFDVFVEHVPACPGPDHHLVAIDPDKPLARGNVKWVAASAPVVESAPAAKNARKEA